jgi:hypothetical protein
VFLVERLESGGGWRRPQPWRCRSTVTPTQTATSATTPATAPMTSAFLDDVDSCLGGDGCWGDSSLEDGGLGDDGLGDDGFGEAGVTGGRGE